MFTGYKKNLPPLARPNTLLEIIGSPVNKAKNNNTLYLAKKNNKLYYVKQSSNPQASLELEVYSSLICRRLAGYSAVAKLTPYYDEQGEIHEIAGKALENFKTANERPLLSDDCHVNLAFFQQGTEHLKIRQALFLLLEELNNSLPPKNKFLSFSLWQPNFFNNELTVKDYQYFLTCLREQPQVFTREQLLSLQEIAHKRCYYLKYAGSKTGELKILRRLLESIDYLLYLQEKTTADNHSLINNLYTLEEISQQCIDQQLDLTKVATVDIIVNNTSLQIPSKDILNFRRDKQLGISFTTRFIYQEGDLNKNNVDNNGLILDFGMTKFQISCHFQQQFNVLEQFLRKSQTDTFKCDPYNVIFFPALHNPSLYFWLTKVTHISEQLLILLNKSLNLLPILSKAFALSLANKIEEWCREAMGNADNYFTAEDAEIYQQLNCNPIFDFYKYKTFLHYLLITPAIYQATIAISVSANHYYYNDENQKINLQEALLADEIARIEEIKTVLLKLPEFKNFLINDGEFALQLIAKEFAHEHEDLMKKIKHKSYFSDLLAAINLADIKHHYQRLCTACGVADAHAEHVPPVKVSYAFK